MIVAVQQVEHVRFQGPVAWCAGLIRPRIYLSRKLVSDLDERQLNTVVAHEIRHMERRDNLRRTLVRGATLSWPRRIRASYLADFDRATVAACDCEAARGIGDGNLLYEARQAICRLADPGHAARGKDMAGLVHHMPLATPHRDDEDNLPLWLALTALLLGQVAHLTGFSHLAREALG